MALITDLPASTTVASTDVFIKDTGSATQKITAPNLGTGLVNQASTDSTTASVTNSSNTVSIKKFGGVVLVHGDITMSGNVSAWNTIFTLPSGYRPAASTNVILNGYENGASMMQGYAIVATSGAVTASYALSSGKRYIFDLYIIL